jgi:hypothetical protein
MGVSAHYDWRCRRFRRSWPASSLQHVLAEFALTMLFMAVTRVLNFMIEKCRQKIQRKLHRKEPHRKERQVDVIYLADVGGLRLDADDCAGRPVCP